MRRHFEGIPSLKITTFGRSRVQVKVVVNRLEPKESQFKVDSAALRSISRNAMDGPEGAHNPETLVH
jgi:hypothetical protein